MKWQPIETAPKDGTRVLLFVPPYGASTGHYRAQHNWGETASNWYAHSVLNKEAEPTHWMPLPPPPVNETRQPVNNRRLDEMENRARMAESVTLQVDDFLELIAAARNGLSGKGNVL